MVEGQIVLMWHVIIFSLEPLQQPDRPHFEESIKHCEGEALEIGADMFFKRRNCQHF